ncbi:MAG: LPS export ABC transporter permease LptG [Gammaproteobacteria bacterium]|nr:LPS export ABC transporter permease LptG [Gammaproteobacteria bacterium]
MISTMDRHIGRTVLGTTVVVLLALLGLMTVFTLVEELRNDDATYSFNEALWYVALTTPRRVYEMLPYVAFLGSLVGLGTLASNSEIVVLRTAGVSVQRVFLSVAWPLLGVLAFGALLGEFVAPRGEELAEAHKTRSEQNSDVIVLSGGYWYREGPLYMNINGLDENGALMGLRQYWLDANEELVRSRTASRAEYVDSDDPHWVLRDVVETEFLGESNRIQEYLELRWNGKADPRLLSVRVLVEPRKLSVTDLYYQINYMLREELNPDAYQLAFWGKLLQPFSVLGLALLALCFVLGPLREVSIGVRLSVGVLVGLGFKYLQDLFAPMSLVYELHPALAVAVPIAACWLVGWIGLRRVA